MNIQKRLYQRLEKPAVDERYLSPCHKTGLSAAPVLHIQRDGTTRRIGYMTYCAYSAWVDGKRVECHKPAALEEFRCWPESLSRAEALRICDHIGPEYWLEGGFHVFQWEGKWTTLRAYYGMPPWARRDFAQLDARAQRLVRIYSKAVKGQGAAAIRDEFPADVLPQAKPMPRKKNAGLEAKRAKNLAEQLFQAQALDRQQLASGEGVAQAYEPDLEAGQYSDDDEKRLADQEAEARLAFEKEEMPLEQEPVMEPTRIPAKKADLTEFFDAE